MKTKLNLLVTLTLMLLFTVDSFAQFTIKGEFRNRTEFNASQGGRNALVADKTDSYLSTWQRSRIIALYKNDKLETKFSFQDVRAFGSNGAWASNNGATLALHEAWAKYNITENVGFKMGRQELKLADARLMWNKDWAHTGASYDAFSLEVKTDKINLVAGIALNSVDPRGAYAGYKHLGFFSAGIKLTDDIKVNITDLYEGIQEVDESTTAGETDYKMRSRNTIGLNPVAKFGPVTFNGSFYYQMGLANKVESVETKYAAMMYAASLSYKVNDMIGLTAGYDSYSGEAWDDDQSDNKVKAFTSPYAGAHKFFGNTDFHLKMFGKGYGANDIYLKVNAKISKKTALGFGFHNISFAQEAILADGTTKFKAVGNNIDFQIKQGLGKGMALIAGFSAMLPSDEYVKMTLGDGVDAKFHQFTWIMFKFTPTFLKTEKKEAAK